MAKASKRINIKLQSSASSHCYYTEKTSKTPMSVSC